jgi:hypothetical protein
MALKAATHLLLGVCGCAGVTGALYALSGGMSPAPATAAPASGSTAIISPVDFVVQHVCNSAGDFLNCAGALHPQTTAETARYRKHDLPASTGYQIGDCTLNADGSMPCQFSYAPFGRFTAANGDGGDLYVTDPDGTTRVKETQDGGKMGMLQHFTGPECGADGWVSFTDHPPTGSWASMVARLNDTPTAICPERLNQAFTRWRLENIQWTFYERALPQTVTLPTIVSEHYGAATIAGAKSMERFFYAKGAGRVRWSAWAKAAPAGSQLSARCPPVAYDVAPDDNGWSLSDCRTWTAIEPAAPGWAAAMYGWPPPEGPEERR